MGNKRCKVRNAQRYPSRSGLAIAVLLACTGAQAVELANTDSVSVRWDNTLKYGAGIRTASPSDYYVGNPNLNDGDAAFARHDMITNRVDLLSELDVAWKTAVPSGFRVSAAAWYDRVYNKKHDAVPAATYNQSSVPVDEFTANARRLAGHKAEILDAFVYGGLDVGAHRLQMRLGRHTLIWGESLFMASNGIAGGMASVDVLKALAVPQTPAKELFRPTNQLSATLSLNDQWSLQSYYQLEFRENRFPPVGTFFSPADIVYQGMENLLTPAGPLPYKGVRNKPRDAQGNWGIAAKYSNTEADLDLGFYYVRYTDRTSQLYTDAFGVAGAPGYHFVYPRDVEIFGASASSSVGNANVAGEASVRRNVPLLSNALAMDLASNPAADNDRNPLYAVGDLVHLQASTIWVLPRVGMWDTATLTAEVGGHHLYNITRNEAARDNAKKRTYAGANVVLEPTWYQIVPDLDMSIPLSVGYSFTGYSPVDPTAIAHGGSVTTGVSFVFQRDWRARIDYTKYLGKDANHPVGDRDNLVLSIARTF
jgi:hypothetical protein